MRYARIAPANMLPHLLYPLSGYISQSILCQLHYVQRTPYAGPTYVYWLQVFHPCTTLYIPSGGTPCYVWPVRTWLPSGNVPRRYVHSVTPPQLVKDDHWILLAGAYELNPRPQVSEPYISPYKVIARDLDRAQNELDTIRSMYGWASVRYSIRSSQMNLDTWYDPRTSRTCVHVRTYMTNWPVAL